MKIIIDTREQKYLDFSPFKNIETEFCGLKTGDYSISGYEDKIAFERKSVEDLCGTLISGHTRFLKEMERFAGFDEKYILVEQKALGIYLYLSTHGKLSYFNIIIQSLLAYAYHYHVRIRFCKDRADMADYIIKKAKEFIKKEEKNDKT